MATMELAGTLDLRAAAPLRDALLALRGEDVRLDGSAVRQLGGLCLQVLLSAEATWRADGHGFVVAPASAALAGALRSFGASLPLEGEMA